MIKNKTTQIIYQTAYITLGLVGVVASLGFFDMEFRWDFYILFTDLSNYFCIIIMLKELIQTVKRDKDGYVSATPFMKFCGLLGILLTFLVFNLLLAHASGRNPADNYKVASVLLHIMLPLMYTADWILFYEKGKCRLSYPLLSILYPLVYLAYVYIHAAILRFDTSILNYHGTDPLIYPYFFLNPERVGITGVIRWCAALLVLFAVGGFAFVGIDRLIMHIKAKTGVSGREES